MPGRRRLAAISTIAAAPLALLLMAATPPAPKLEGTWTWTWKDGQEKAHKHVLEVVGDDPKPTLRERFDDEGPVKVIEYKRDGEKVRFVVVRGMRTSTYTGKFGDDDTINGQVIVAQDGQSDVFNWTAKRRPAKP